MFLTREQILGAADLEERIVEVPEWGGDVLVRGITGAERDLFEKSCIEMKGKNREFNTANFRAKLVALSIVDPDTKKPMFTQVDINALGKKSAKALNRVYDVATELSGFGDEEVEELTKNSESIPNDTPISN